MQRIEAFDGCKEAYESLGKETAESAQASSFPFQENNEYQE